MTAQRFRKKPVVMGCTVHDLGDGAELFLCRPTTWSTRHVRFCPTCERRRRFVRTHMGVWYPCIWTCCACGDAWSEGERLSRPFARGWRDEATRRARREWVEAVSHDEDRRMVEAELAPYLEVKK